jgi:hypothetical protein
VFDAVALEVAETYNAAGEDGPQLGFGEVLLVQFAFGDLGEEGALRVLIDSIYFIEGRAVLILRGHEEVCE